MKIPFLYNIKKKFRQQRRSADRVKVKVDFYADSLGVKRKILDIFHAPDFKDAWEKARKANEIGWAGNVPDIRWRAHVCCWAAQNAARLEGDFVEMGVHTGLLSKTVCHFMNFADLPKTFYLFDTFKGIPIAPDMTGKELELAERNNQDIYSDVFDITRENFAEFPNVRLVKGVLPGSIEQVSVDKISYLSIDLNSAYHERNSIEFVWDKIVKGGIVIIDDYLWKGHRPQFDMWNAFATGKGVAVLALPTGQGMIVK